MDSPLEYVASATAPRLAAPGFPRSVLLVETWRALPLATDLARAGLTVHILPVFEGNCFGSGMSHRIGFPGFIR